jgi:hypothetical protein
LKLLQGAAAKPQEIADVFVAKSALHPSPAPDPQFTGTNYSRVTRTRLILQAGASEFRRTNLRGRPAAHNLALPKTSAPVIGLEENLKKRLALKTALCPQVIEIIGAP